MKLAPTATTLFPHHSSKHRICIAVENMANDEVNQSGAQNGLLSAS